MIAAAPPLLHHERQGKDQAQMPDPQNPLQRLCRDEITRCGLSVLGGKVRAEVVDQTRDHSEHNQRQKPKRPQGKNLEPQQCQRQ